MLVDVCVKEFKLRYSKIVVLRAIHICHGEFVRGRAYVWNDHVRDGRIAFGVRAGRHFGA